MSVLMNGASVFQKGGPAVLMNALLRIIDIGGKDLRVFAVNGDQAKTLRDVGETNIANCTAIAVYFVDNNSIGHINSTVVALGGEASAAGKRFAVIGVTRKQMSGEAQRLCDWVIY